MRRSFCAPRPCGWDGARCLLLSCNYGRAGAQWAPLQDEHGFLGKAPPGSFGATPLVNAGSKGFSVLVEGCVALSVSLIGCQLSQRESQGTRLTSLAEGGGLPQGEPEGVCL